MPTIEVTDATFEDLVLRSTKPVLVDFWATWCAPCRMVAPVLEELSDEYADSVTIAKLDVDASPMVAQALRVQSIPTLVMFVDGRPVKAVQGAQPKEVLVELIEESVPELQKPTIDVEELAVLLDRGAPVTVVDIRDPRDFSRSHLRHAKCVAPEDLRTQLQELDPRSLVVLVDRTGERSTELAGELADARPRVVALAKGILEWEGSGRDTFSDKEEAKLDARG